jgi:hypothetical protein
MKLNFKLREDINTLREKIYEWCGKRCEKDCEKAV